MLDVTTLITVTGREGNRRDALISCGVCGESFIPLYFYEPPGRPLLDGALLWVSHYNKCLSLLEEDIMIQLSWDDARSTDTLIFSPATRTLRQTQSGWAS
jgi:hypothetical protein